MGGDDREIQRPSESLPAETRAELASLEVEISAEQLADENLQQLAEEAAREAESETPEPTSAPTARSSASATSRPSSNPSRQEASEDHSGQSMIEKFFDSIKKFVDDILIAFGLKKKDEEPGNNERVGTAPGGPTMTTAQALEQDRRFASLYQGSNQHLETIIGQAQEIAQARSGGEASRHWQTYARRTLGQPNYDAMSDQLNYTEGQERRACSLYVSKLLGFNRPIGAVRNLAPTLVSMWLEQTNGASTGIVTGFSNMRRGDAIFFRGSQRYGYGRYGHVALVQGVEHIEVGGRRRDFLIYRDEGADIQATIVPVHESDNQYLDDVRRIYRDPSQRSRYRELQAAYDYRSSHPETVRFKENRRYNGDATQNGGNIMFAIRTEGLRRG